ncbi:MAG: hypothetical protein O2913_12000 [Chloroflexi bacterium]|nr:hypothetical protein [Chloroflexota bacterium]
MNPSYIAPTPDPEAVKPLETWVSGTLDTQYQEIRTLQKVGGGSKKFCRLSGLRQVGDETPLPGYLEGRESVCYGVAPQYEPRQAESNTDLGDLVNLATTRWQHEISRPPPDLPPCSWLVETGLGWWYEDVAPGPSAQLLPEGDGDKNRGDGGEGTPGCISTPTQPGTKIPCTLTQGSGSDVSYSIERNASAATVGGGCCGHT